VITSSSDRDLRKSANRIHIGGVFASREPAVVYTLLGSCIAVCLHDPFLGIGGMNHFMLPQSGAGEEASARYGIHAMELLINACMKKGADRRRLAAKVFGGGHVLRIRENEDNVPQSNIKFALAFLQTECIPIVSRDLGGYVGREIFFFTETGKTLLKRMQSTHGSKSVTREENRDRNYLHAVAQVALPVDDNNITLF
jgi:chemotaxis protein CheD